MFDLVVARPETEVTLMRRDAVITKASRRIVRATALVLAGRRPASRQDQGDDQTAWWLARQVVAGQRGRLRIETPEKSFSRASSRFAKPTWRCWSHPTGFTRMSPRAAARPTPLASSTCCGPLTPNPICRSSPSGCAPTTLRSSRTENGVTVVEGLDPDGARVLIGYPSPFQLPRAVIAARLHA